MKTYVVGQVPSGYAPLPPENVLINGARYPADISGQYTISWAPNPREHVHGPAVSGDETYTLRLYDETNALRRTVTGITGNSYTWSTELLDMYGDTFDSDTSANYTTFGPGTWSISGGELLGVGGNAENGFIRNGVSFADGYIEVDSNYAYDAGLILRFVDSLNYYILFLADDSGWNPTNNIRLYKFVAGVATQLTANINIAWTRGTTKTIRFEASGTTLKGFVDGSQVITATDSTFSAAGGAGIRSAGVGFESKFQTLRLPSGAYNASIRAELETVRGGVTSYQKQIIKSTRSVTAL